MKAVLVFIDGTICDTRHRDALFGTEEFYSEENILKDSPTAGSVDFLKELSKKYLPVYIGARPDELEASTARWLCMAGFPQGEIYLGESLQKRKEIVSYLKARYDFAAGIGDRWDDNELHLEIGCQSFILREYFPDWSIVKKYLLDS